MEEFKDLSRFWIIVWGIVAIVCIVFAAILIISSGGLPGLPVLVKIIK